MRGRRVRGQRSGLQPPPSARVDLVPKASADEYDGRLHVERHDLFVTCNGLQPNMEAGSAVLVDYLERCFKCGPPTGLREGARDV